MQTTHVRVSAAYRLTVVEVIVEHFFLFDELPPLVQAPWLEPIVVNPVLAVAKKHQPAERPLDLVFITLLICPEEVFELLLGVYPFVLQ